MTTLPAASYISNSARTEAEVKQALEDMIAVQRQQPGGATAATSTLTIATGAVTPTTGIHLIDTEAAASTDDLDTINQTNLPDGSLLMISAANAGRTVVVKHNIGGAAKIVLADAADLSLVGTTMSLLLKRNGAQWDEKGRFYAANAIKSIASAATVDLGSANGDLVRVTGTTTITSLGTAAAGTWRWVIFDGALVLTHNATSLILPTGANIMTKAGAVVGFVSEGSGNWRMMSYSDVPYLASANTFTAAQTVNIGATAGTALTAISTEAGAASGPNIVLDRQSASPAVNDTLGTVRYLGRDSGGNAVQYLTTYGLIIDPTDTSEDAEFRVNAQVAGADTLSLRAGDGIVSGAATGGMKGIGTVNAVGLYVQGHGTVAQQVSTTNTTYTDLPTILPFDDSIPQITEGEEVMTLAITPVNAASTLVIDVTVHLGGNTGETQSAALFVDATAGALAAASTIMANTATMNTVTFRHSVSAASLTARTYRVRCGSMAAANGKLNGHNTSRIFGGVATSSITITEILPQ